MTVSMNDTAAQQKKERRSRVGRWIAIGLGLGSVVMFFLPMMTFVFRDTTYVVSGLDLAFARGFWVEGKELSGLVGIPVLLRIAVLASAILAVAGSVLLFFRKATLAGIAYVASGVCPLVMLVSTSSIQSAVRFSCKSPAI